MTICRLAIWALVQVLDTQWECPPPLLDYKDDVFKSSKKGGNLGFSLKSWFARGRIQIFFEYSEYKNDPYCASWILFIFLGKKVFAYYIYLLTLFYNYHQLKEGNYWSLKKPFLVLSVVPQTKSPLRDVATLEL